jgi:hypothetical protein
MDVDVSTMAPTSGDGRCVGVPGRATLRTSGWTRAAEREPSLDSLVTIAQSDESHLPRQAPDGSVGVGATGGAGVA